MSSKTNIDLIDTLEQTWQLEQICQGCKLWRSYEELDELWHCINTALHDPQNVDNWTILDTAKREIEIQLSTISQLLDEPVNDDLSDSTGDNI